MWRSDNYGNSWVPVNFHDSIKNIFGWSYVTDITVNPDDEDELWICFGNTNHESRKVYHSADSGASWNGLRSGYPENIPAHCIEYDEISKLLYVGTDVGIYFWDTDDPSSWSKLDDDFNKIVSEIVINKTRGKLRVATFGNGIWETYLPMCYSTGSDLYITSNQTWSDTTIVCSDTYIDGATLTISGTVYMNYQARIFVKQYSSLIISGGIVKNAHIIIEDGGIMYLEDRGELFLNSDDTNIIVDGATFHFEDGSIHEKPE
jgi:hypothetical protein